MKLELDSVLAYHGLTLMFSQCTSCTRSVCIVSTPCTVFVLVFYSFGPALPFDIVPFIILLFLKQTLYPVVARVIFLFVWFIVINSPREITIPALFQVCLVL